MPPFLKTEELATQLHVSPQTIYRWRRRGLPAKRMGTGICSHYRYDAQQVNAWLARVHIRRRVSRQEGAPGDEPFPSDLASALVTFTMALYPVLGLATTLEAEGGTLLPEDRQELSERLERLQEITTQWIDHLRL